MKAVGWNWHIWVLVTGAVMIVGTGMALTRYLPLQIIGLSAISISYVIYVARWFAWVKSRS
jgi:hypothetical protein